MISPGYILDQFRAVLDMGRNNPAWVKRLDTDVEGFYRSFSAIGLSLPLVLLALFMMINLVSQVPTLAADMDNDTPRWFLGVLQVTVTLTVWAGTIAMLVFVARGMKQERRISPLIVGFNWSELMIQCLLTLTLFAVLLTPSPSAFSGLLLGVFIFAFWVRWGVVRRSLEGNIVQSIAVVAMIYIVAFFINMVVSALGHGLLDLFMPEAADQSVLRVIEAKD